MTKTKAVIYAILFALVLAVLWFVRHRADKHIDVAVSSPTLAPSDREKLIINQHTHTLTEVTRDAKGNVKIKKEYLPSTANVEEHNDGSIQVSGRKWGTEISPSAGVLYGSDFTLRAAGTLGLFYCQRFDIGIGVGMASHINSARALVAIQYNFYGSMLVGAYVDNHRDAGVLCSLRFN